MTETVTRPVPAIVDELGEIMPLDLTVALSAEEAAELYPRARAHLARLRSFTERLAEIVTADMAEAGQTERRVGQTLYELKSEARWIVNDAPGLYGELEGARDRGEITQVELDDAAGVTSVHRFHNGRLSALAKRLPVIERFRRRVEDPATLRIKAGK